jgi:5-aminolevulinate synthase
MDGDIAPVREIVELAEQHNALTYIDEVHAVALYGRGEEGSRNAKVSRTASVSSTHARQRIRLAWRIHCRPTLQSSMPCGAMRRSSFYDHLAAQVGTGACAAIRHLKASNEERTEQQYIAAVTKHALRAAGLPILDNASHIVPLMIGDADRCKVASDLLLNRRSIYIQPINYPTVPIRTERRASPSEPTCAAVLVTRRSLALFASQARRPTLAQSGPIRHWEHCPFGTRRNGLRPPPTKVL